MHKRLIFILDCKTTIMNQLFLLTGMAILVVATSLLTTNTLNTVTAYGVG